MDPEIADRTGDVFLPSDVPVLHAELVQRPWLGIALLPSDIAPVVQRSRLTRGRALTSYTVDFRSVDMFDSRTCRFLSIVDYLLCELSKRKLFVLVEPCSRTLWKLPQPPTPHTLIPPHPHPRCLSIRYQTHNHNTTKISSSWATIQ